MNKDLISRNLAISYAVSGLVRRIDEEDWIRVSEVKQSINDIPSDGCYECAKEHEQLAAWLEELKDYKKALALACESLEKMCDVTNCDEVNCPIREDCDEQFGGFDIYFFNKAKELRKARESNDT